MIFYGTLPDEFAPIVADVRNDLATRFSDHAPKVLADTLDVAAGLAVLSEHLRLRAQGEWNIDSARNYFGTTERLFACMCLLGPSKVAGSHAERLMSSNMRNAQSVMSCISPVGFA